MGGLGIPYPGSALKPKDPAVSAASGTGSDQSGPYIRIYPPAAAAAISLAPEQGRGQQCHGHTAATFVSSTDRAGPEAVVAFDQSTEECHLMSLTPSFIVRIRLYFKDIAKLKVLR